MPSTLPVVERFHSLQGEGAHAGRSAFFIRLASCEVKCSWCDTKNSWSESNFPYVNVVQISNKVANARLKGAGFVEANGKHDSEKLHSGACSILQIASISGSPFQKSAWISGLIFF